MTLHVINPNSNTTVTAGIDAAMEPLRGMGVEIACHTLEESPRGIESQRDADSVIVPLCRRIEALETRASGFVIACFSDPGLFSARETTSKPVLGIMECGVLTALTLGQSYGIIAILPNSVNRHIRALRGLGLTGRLAGDRPLGLRVQDLADPDRTAERMAEIGRTLRDQDGADVLVMGCAGMARYREMLEQETGLPVVEPCQAAAGLAISRIKQGI
jgi:Asp/Glu/hydantoin racemase